MFANPFYKFVKYGILNKGSSIQLWRNISSSTASISKVHRQTYARYYYPTVLVFPDGSTINIRYHEPRLIIKLPLDIDTLNEEERKKRLESRKPKQKVKIIEGIKHTFNPNKYVNMIKKK